MKTKKIKVFFTVDEDINREFEKYCEYNFINKSKIVERLIKVLIDKPSEINDILKNN
jgi:hypothetical protein